ncbi:MAG: VOC family protein [Gaiellales bacterium]
MSGDSRPRLVGLNHVALEVGDVGEALEFYGEIFEFTLRNRFETAAFIDIGDQFIALAAVADEYRDRHRHFGLVVDSLDAARRALEEAGVTLLPGRGVGFHDPWGNRVQVVEYSQIQFSKAPAVLTAMGLDDLGKSQGALEELQRKGIA